MTIDYWLFLFILFTTIFISVKKDKLTWGGGVTGAGIACCIFLGAGFRGLAMIGLFFLLGTVATSWQINAKEKLGAAEDNKGRRTAGQVVANGGAAGILGLLSFFFPGQQNLFQLMMAAAISSATADTLSSELGTVYGKKFYNILSFQYDRPGENGVVSIEGMLFGIAGSMLIAIIYALGFGWTIGFWWILVSGTVGNIADSILGATVEKKRYLKNDSVNFMNTVAGALTALILNQLLGS
ncbi:MAG: DUF92 domain-containing protein [Ferruginibacter sp.]|nr:DUF92 domain-containing protein [Ferruginibacter sp.]